MQIFNLDELMQDLQEMILEFPYKEYGALACVHKLNDYTFSIDECDYLKDSDVNSKANTLFIPRLTSYKFLKYCSEYQKLPFLIHTHPYYGSEDILFSRQDYRFIRRFLQLAEELRIGMCLFMVTNGAKYQILIDEWGNQKKEVGKFEVGLEKGFFNSETCR